MTTPAHPPQPETPSPPEPAPPYPPAPAYSAAPPYSAAPGAALPGSPQPQAPLGYAPPLYPPPPIPQTVPVIPGRGLGIAGLVLAFIFPPLGLIFSIIGKVLSRRVNYKNVPAIIGIIASAFLIVVGIVVMVLMVNHIVNVCNELGPGVHQRGLVTYTCGPGQFGRSWQFGN